MAAIPRLSMANQAEEKQPGWASSLPSLESHGSLAAVVVVVRDTGFEPVFPAWEAGVLPLN